MHWFTLYQTANDWLVGNEPWRHLKKKTSFRSLVRFLIHVVSKKNQRVQRLTWSLPLSILALPPSCTFDNGWCQWRPLINSRGFTWQLGSNSTRDRLSGPDGDHTTKCNLYNHHFTYFPVFIYTEHVITIEY